MTGNPLPVLDGRKLMLRYKTEVEGTAVDMLFKAALILLDDGCPPDPKQYLCVMDQADDETACHRCWEEYLFRIRNS